jgi:hypothetical protein
MKVVLSLFQTGQANMPRKFFANSGDRCLPANPKKVKAMQQQKKMEESFLRAHREFVNNLVYSLELLEKDIREAAEMQQICTDEWCQATESVLDDLAKMIYSISEPRWLTQEDSQKIKELRKQVHDLYAQYKKVKA